MRKRCQTSLEIIGRLVEGIGPMRYVMTPHDAITADAAPVGIGTRGRKKTDREKMKSEKKKQLQ
ncbi:MAG: hypothetical protein LUH14_04295 [Clostridiaceae bacterium]|nr:hypothetical protein [Clostridiaceae bacterium]